MKKIILLLILLTVVNSNVLADEKPVLISAEKHDTQKKSKIAKSSPKTDKNVKKEKVARKSCRAGAPAWMNPEDIKSEGGEWQVEDSACAKHKWLGEKPEGMVCAEGCTSDALEEMGMD